MNPRHGTNFWLWAVCAAIAYCLLMAIPLDGGKGPSHVGWLWLDVLSQPWHPVAPVIFGFLVVAYGAVAAALGWVAHAILLVLHGIVVNRRPALDSSPPASE